MIKFNAYYNTRRHSELDWKRNWLQTKVVKLDNETLMKRWFFYDSDKIEIRSPWSGGYLTHIVNS